VRDIIQPGRDLGHVDGKKKSTTTATPSQEQEIKKEQEKESTVASLSHLDSNSTQIVDGKKEGDGIKRNADGSICEDCN